MKGFVELVGISNFVRLGDGASENRLIIKLPNGNMIDPLVSDEHLAAVVESFGAPPAKPTPSPGALTMEEIVTGINASESFPFVAEKQENGEQALVFGAPPDAVEVPSPPPAPRKARLVDVDSAGNPVVHIEGGEDTESVTGSGGIKDEDGVAQL